MSHDFAGDPRYQTHDTSAPVTDAISGEQQVRIAVWNLLRSRGVTDEKCYPAVEAAATEYRLAMQAAKPVMDSEVVEVLRELAELREPPAPSFIGPLANRAAALLAKLEQGA